VARRTPAVKAAALDALSEAGDDLELQLEALIVLAAVGYDDRDEAFARAEQAAAGLARIPPPTPDQQARVPRAPAATRAAAGSQGPRRSERADERSYIRTAQRSTAPREETHGAARRPRWHPVIATVVPAPSDSRAPPPLRGGRLAPDPSCAAPIPLSRQHLPRRAGSSPPPARLLHAPRRKLRCPRPKLQTAHPCVQTDRRKLQTAHPRLHPACPKLRGRCSIASWRAAEAPLHATEAPRAHFRRSPSCGQRKHCGFRPLLTANHKVTSKIVRANLPLHTYSAHLFILRGRRKDARAARGIGGFAHIWLRTSAP